MATFGGSNIITDGLVLWLDAANRKSYPGSGTSWLDLSGNNNTGTLTNGPAFSSANNGSIVFDGVDDSISVLNNSSLNFGTNPFTVSVILYIRRSGLFGSREYGIINKNTTFQSSAGWGMELSTYGSTSPFDLINYQFYNTGQSVWGNSNTAIQVPTNTWFQVTGIRNSTNASLYYNGVLRTEKSSSDMGLSVSNATNIVMGYNSWGVYFPGNIALTQIYNRALSAQEVRQNYDALKSRYLNIY
jgi:hypothetical protein